MSASHKGIDQHVNVRRLIGALVPLLSEGIVVSSFSGHRLRILMGTSGTEQHIYSQL